MHDVIVIPGSARRASLNKQLGVVAAESLRAAGLGATFADPADFVLPLYDGDLEAESGLPEAATRLKQLIRSHAGIVFVSPEYNSAPTPLLKNLIDWCSRPGPGEKPLEAFAGKHAALLSASPGALGGLRGLVHLRLLLSAIRVQVVAEEFALAKAHEAFDESGALRDPQHRGSVDRVIARLAHALR